MLGLTNDSDSIDEPGDACGCPLGDAIEGECCDRQDVRLPGKQPDLLQAAASAVAPGGKVGTVALPGATIMTCSSSCHLSFPELRSVYLSMRKQSSAHADMFLFCSCTATCR